MALLLAAVNLRPGITSLAPLIERIAAELALSRGLISLTTALPVLCMGLLAPLAPRLAVLLGLERTITLCMGAIAAALLLRLGGDASAVLIASAVLLGAGIAVAGPLLSGFIKRYFVEQMGRVVAWYSLGMAVGGAAGAVLTASATHWFGERWTHGLALWALPALLAMGAWLCVPNRGEPSDREEARACLPWDQPRAWLISTFFAIQAGLFYALATWVVARYHEAGLSLLRSNGLFSLSMLTGLPSSFLFPWLAQRFGHRYGLLQACGLLACLSLAMITFAPTLLPELWAVVIGLSLGGAFALSLVLPLYEAHTPLAVSRWTSMMLCAGYCMASLAPVLTGLARDLAGSYQPAFAVLTGLASLMSLLAWRLGKGVRRD
ncbi:MFS transporter [Pseudomonas lalucatii]|uniref:MFS transporter n=1 Tax=Pseudomonas lalucatii TaxID=1424203 RepID=A0ABS5PWQ3_9PSED|nr:MFS transporter [Pseudomonas lalucatii]MBS7660926.1 MFS transporter [Pseudomonas lalucatii]MBS7724374.1 MFS transporter [Pseudomonas lalucatii]QVM88987.1 MFS transporter [Pseudomonas lalucatii]